jgi:cysteinyl-tRNA synthetase, unknown class
VRGDEIRGRGLGLSLVGRRSVLIRSALAVATWSLGGAVAPRAEVEEAVVGDKKGRAMRSDLLTRVERWGCQYQKLEAAQIAASDLDLIVIDNTLDGRAITPDVMASLKRKPDGSRRLVLAYLSVGEAERHRPYFPNDNPPPDWLGPENPAWPGSFPTRYWLPTWQSILFGATGSWLDRIIQGKFDGALLDRVDAYGDWRAERPSAMEEMARLVADLARYARSANPAFILIGQNAEALLPSDDYRGAIDAVSKESLLYGMAGPGVPNKPEDIDWSLTHLRSAQRDGLKVFAIEYLDGNVGASQARAVLATLGFTPFFADRLLDRLPGSDLLPR